MGLRPPAPPTPPSVVTKHIRQQVYERDGLTVEVRRPATGGPRLLVRWPDGRTELALNTDDEARVTAAVETVLERLGAVYEVYGTYQAAVSEFVAFLADVRVSGQLEDVE